MSDVNVRAIITAEDRASQVLGGISNQLRSLGQVAGGLISLHVVADALKDIANSWEESSKVGAQLDAVLKSTGDVSGWTADQANSLSRSLQQLTVYSDETIGSAQNMLLTFTNIGGSIMPEATRAVLDMSTALGQDTKDSAIQLGKALNDPILGVTALRRVGVAFNETQRQTIQNLVESGQGLKAQKMILKELETEFGGSAQAMAKTFGGQLKILGNNVDDVKERMGQVLAEGLRPLVLGISEFVRNNGELIASLGLAAIAAVGFGGTVIAVVGAIGLAIAIMGGPFTIALLAISALLGATVFKAAQNLQGEMKKTAQNFSSNSQAMKTDGANNFGATSQAASDLASKLADIDAQMTKTTRDFKESLAQIVSDHRKKVTDLQKGLDQENRDFADSQTDKADQFKQSQDDMTREHERKVADISAQLKQEQIAADGSNQDKINSLQLSLAQENEDYNRHFNDNAAKYQKDVDKATAAHQAKTADFKGQLDEETVFLQKHNADIASVQNVQLLDEIDKLKRSHVEQMQEFEKQKIKIIANASQTSSGIAAALNTVPMKIDTPAFDNIGTKIGTAVKDAFVQTITGIPGAVANWAIDYAKKHPFTIAQDLFAPMFPQISAVGKALHIPGFASGVENFSGGLAYVHQGEVLTNLAPGTSVIPKSQVESGLGGHTTINVTANVGVYAGSEIEKRKIAKELFNSLKDIAGAKNMTVGEMLA